MTQTMKTEARIETLRSKIEKLTGCTDTRLDDLTEALMDAARAEGARGIMMDLYDAELLSTEAVEFAAENNGIDPRR